MTTQTQTTLEFKMGVDGFSGLYRINCRGPWRTEYKTDSLLNKGTYPVMCDGKIVGQWIQETLCHRLIATV